MDFLAPMFRTRDLRTKSLRFRVQVFTCSLLRLKAYLAQGSGRKVLVSHFGRKNSQRVHVAVYTLSLE